ncbi:MAG: hypothetical protein Q7S22_04170 [Candidatus Micrarchaeota archaeon]|nr:hypothetical protein [Candidatus Micrarchaeota archaeon]
MTTTHKSSLTNGRRKPHSNPVRNFHLSSPLVEILPHKQKRNKHGRISIPESYEILRYGAAMGQRRTTPSKTARCSFRRVMGNIFEHDNIIARRELKRMFERIEIYGAFLVLGHGGGLPCGAVSAKQSHAEHSLEEHSSILQVLEKIPSEVLGRASPIAETLNARHQASMLLDDHEFGAIIRERNITVVTGICTDSEIRFEALNRTGWNTSQLIEQHPLLGTLSKQMKKALKIMVIDGKDIKEQFAHVLFVWDPEDLKKVNGQDRNELSVGGICCVDARLPPRTPGPRFILGVRPGEAAGVTCAVNGSVDFTGGEIASIKYLLDHVKGIAPHLGGNGHIVTFASNLETAEMIRRSIIADGTVDEETQDGKTISIASFNGRSLIVRNEHFEQEIVMPYNPVARIF